MEILHLDSIISKGIYKGKTIGELAEKKGLIFSLIKKGMLFDDEVLKKAHIRKTIRDVKYTLEVVDHKSVSSKKYNKDTMSLDKVINKILSASNNNDE